MTNIEKIHRIIFGHEMSLMMKDFLRHLSWSFVGIIFNAAVLFLFNILAGRILGPAGYGKYNLILVIGTMLAIPILFGQDSVVVKYIAEERDKEKKKKYLSNSFRVITFLSAAALLLSVAFYLSVNSNSGFDKRIIFTVLIFSIVYGYKNILDSIIRGYHYFKFQALAKVIEGVTILILFAGVFLMKLYTYEYFFLCILASSFLIGLVYFFKIRKLFVKWDKDVFRNILTYSKASLIFGILSVLISSSDKIFIGKFVGSETLGLYSAYFASTTIIVGQFILILNNVLFPMVSSVENKYGVLKKIEKTMILSALPIILVIFLLSYITMKLFGSAFYLSYFYLTIFSIVAFLQIVSNLYRTLIQSANKTFITFKNINLILFGFQLLIYFLLYFFELTSFGYLVIAYATVNFLVLILSRIILTKVNLENYAHKQ